jgi:hypothetical protein
VLIREQVLVLMFVIGDSRLKGLDVFACSHFLQSACWAPGVVVVCHFARALLFDGDSALIYQLSQVVHFGSYSSNI